MPFTNTNAYALLIGVSKHVIPEFDLPVVAKDIQALHHVLIHPERCAYSKENVHALIGKEATRENIEAELKWLKQKVAANENSDTTVFVYFSGHGWRDELFSPPEYYR